MNTRTIAGLLRHRAGSRSDEIAIRFKEDTGFEAWTWLRFWEEAVRVAAGLRESGVRPGDRVLVLVPEVKAAVTTLFGIWSLGAVPIPIGLPFRLTHIESFLEQLRKTAEKLSARALVTSRALTAFAGAPGPVRVLCAEELSITPHGFSPDPDAAPGPALIQLTSGSTGHPRGVVLGHERLMLHMACMSEALPSHAESVAVSWLPLHHDMGLIGGLLFPFYNGFVANMLAPQDFRARPLAWLEAMSSLRATICAAPPSAYALVLRLARRAAEAGLDLRPWECAMIGAEPISPGLLRRFAEAFGPVGFRAEAFFPVYGLAEATVAVSFPKLLAPSRFAVVDRETLERTGRAVAIEPGPHALELVCVGKPIPQTDVRITGENGEALPERHVGEIEVRAPTLMHEYLDDRAATAAVFRDGYLRTGDLGYVDRGELFVTGRKKDLIIKGGHNLLPSVIEEIVSEVEDVRNGCVVAVGVRAAADETELVYVIAETKLDPTAHDALGERVRAALLSRGIGVDRVVFVPPGTLPKTTSGKLRRRAVAEALSQGRSLEST
ncbi:AMP-binding protein [Polyangium jinanense]|uniref:AMP-binding protein n=1 Tax=Polyangium jinanense TaxID=2829994 RepID=A0A9X3X5R9_9BACT|nr:AMP-binding protein [Polyangium jinanense]MDC3959710.1 AMP-binding protein [Polyangium jinanense]MDC3984122.1 AMP-binding protein [Polyangium jinanense]